MPTRWIRSLIIAFCLLCSVSAMAEPPLKFQFDAKGNVRADETYDATGGYGFEPVEADAPWTRFSMRMPEGNYRVTVRLGARDRASQTSVAAETRRSMPAADARIAELPPVNAAQRFSDHGL